jgi:hypothetical protein
MNKQQLIKFLQVNPGYQKKGVGYLAHKFHLSHDVVKQALSESKIDIPVVKHYDSEYEEFLAWKASKFSIKIQPSKSLPTPYIGNPDNVIVVGDLHAPFILDGYLEFIREQQEKYDCGTVIFIGDIIDGHSWSYHEVDVDGDNVGEELSKAVKQLQDWYCVFPKATVLYGNHDLLVARKAKTAGLSKHFVRDLGEILHAPKDWKFTHELIINMQVGCGIDHHAYAFEYARPVAKKPVISCGIVLDKGTLPFVKLMKL